MLAYHLMFEHCIEPRHVGPGRTALAWRTVSDMSIHFTPASQPSRAALSPLSHHRATHSRRYWLRRRTDPGGLPDLDTHTVEGSRQTAKKERACFTANTTSQSVTQICGVKRALRSKSICSTYFALFPISGVTIQ